MVTTEPRIQGSAAWAVALKLNIFVSLIPPQIAIGWQTTCSYVPFTIHIHLPDSPTSLGQLKSFRFNEGIAGDELWPDAWRNIEAKAPYADIKILPKELWKIGYKARISLSKTVGVDDTDGKWDLDILTFSSAQVHSQRLSTFSFFFTIFGNGAWKSQNVTTFFYIYIYKWLTTCPSCQNQ